MCERPHLDDVSVLWNAQGVSIHGLVEVADCNFMTHQGLESLQEPFCSCLENTSQRHQVGRDSLQHLKVRALLAGRSREYLLSSFFVVGVHPAGFQRVLPEPHIV